MNPYIYKLNTAKNIYLMLAFYFKLTDRSINLNVSTLAFRQLSFWDILRANVARLAVSIGLLTIARIHSEIEDGLLESQ